MQKYGYRRTAACCFRRRIRSVEAAGKESCRRKQLATFRARGALDKERWSSLHTMRASGSCYSKKSICVQQIVLVGGTCGSIHVESLQRNRTRCYGPISHNRLKAEQGGGQGQLQGPGTCPL